MECPVKENPGTQSVLCRQFGIDFQHPAQFLGGKLVHVQGIFPGFLLKMRHSGFGEFYLGACRHGFGTRNEGHHIAGLFFR